MNESQEAAKRIILAYANGKISYEEATQILWSKYPPQANDKLNSQQLFGKKIKTNVIIGFIDHEVSENYDLEANAIRANNWLSLIEEFRKYQASWIAIGRKNLDPIAAVLYEAEIEALEFDSPEDLPRKARKLLSFYAKL